MKFNFLKRKAAGVTNYEDAKAFVLTPESELYAAVVTAALSDNFYENTQKRVARIADLISKTNPEYVAKLAVYARKHMNMRSVPLVLAVELAKQHTGDSLVSKAVTGVVQRADEITELLAYYEATNERKGTKKLNKLSKQVQKGLAQSFNTFDEYQFAKYNRDTQVRLRDALFLVHPKAKDEAQQGLFNKIASKTLAIPYTWETELSALGKLNYDTKEQKDAAVTAKWEELIDSNKLGYMATLRNLRNLLQAQVSVRHIGKVCKYLADPAAVAKSKQLPFRFLAAYRELQAVPSANVTMVLNALEEAVCAAAQNIKGFDEQTSVLVVCDVSGSMQKPISARSSIQLFDIGLILGMLLQSRCKRVMSGMFGDTWKVINMPSKTILSNVQEYYKREGEVGYATNGHLAIEYLMKKKLRMDKVLCFTDCQLWNNKQYGTSFQRAWNDYKAFHPTAQLYIFDLAGYGNTPVSVHAQDVYLVAGWSDKIFDVLQAIQEGGSALEKIKEVVL